MSLKRVKDHNYRITMKKITYILGLIIVFSSLTKAQSTEAWTLQKCISYAHENNIDIKRQELNKEFNENEYKQSKNNRLPDLNFNTDAQFNNGLLFDETSNSTSFGNTYSVNSGLRSSAALFEGLSKANAIKKNKYSLLSSEQDIKMMENEIMLQITKKFMQILYDEALLEVTKEQAALSQLQVDRTQKLVDAGKVALGNLLEMKSQASREALNVTLQENNVALAKLELAQLLDLEDVASFEIESPEIPELTEFLLENPSAIYMNALNLMPQIESQNLMVTSKEYELKEAKGKLLPSLYAFGGLRSQAFFYEDRSNISFMDQYSDNRTGYLGVSLNVPIFNRFQTRTNINNVQIRLNDQRYQLQNEKLKLRKEIQLAYADASSAYKQYIASEEAVKSYEESFSYTQKRFDVGMVNSVDYKVAKTEYTKAQLDLLQAKYEYILRTKVLDFYNGKPIQL